MATFNATGTRLDHAREALEAALALSGKAALLDLGVGIGIAVGPAVVGRTVAGGNVSVLGPTTNLAARLQAAAEAGEIVLSEEAHRRVAQWLEERGLEAVPQTLELKGFDDPQSAFRLNARRPTQLREDREVCAILHSFPWVIANVGLAAFELSQSKHTCAHTGQFCELGPEWLVGPQHTTRTQRDVNLFPIARHEECQLEPDCVSLVARPAILVWFRGMLPAFGFK